MPANTVVVTRAGKWGNPYKITPELRALHNNNYAKLHKLVVECYREWLEGSDEGRLLIEKMRLELRGKNVACFCGLDKPCHGDVILEFANKL